MLVEQGKWPIKGLVLECKDCKERNNDLSRVSCCDHQVMSFEPDFLAQRGAVEELIENTGHKCIFFPQVPLWAKLYWEILGAAKKNLHENCDHCWQGLQKAVPENLESVPLITIRRFSRKCCIICIYIEKELMVN